MNFQFLFLFFGASVAFAQNVSDTVSFVNFENREVGVYGNAEAKEDFKRNTTDKSWWYAMDKNGGQNSKIVYDGEEHGNVYVLSSFPLPGSICDSRRKTPIIPDFAGATV